MDLTASRAGRFSARDSAFEPERKTATLAFTQCLWVLHLVQVTAMRTNNNMLWVPNIFGEPIART